MIDKVQFCYGLFAFSLLCFLVPIDFFQGAVSVLSLLAVWIFVRVARGQVEQESLQASHYQWLNRSFWIFNLYAIIALILFTAIFSANGDHSVMEDFLLQVQEGVEFSVAEIETIEQQYRENNQGLLTVLYVAILAPLMGWAFWRLGRGILLYKQQKRSKRLKAGSSFRILFFS